MRTHSARLAIAAMMVLGAQTVQAQTAPSDPCAGASAGACTAGTLSEPIELMRPVPLRTSAFIAQIGDNNTATISQNGSQQFARPQPSGFIQPVVQAQHQFHILNRTKVGNEVIGLKSKSDLFYKFYDRCKALNSSFIFFKINFADVFGKAGIAYSL